MSSLFLCNKSEPFLNHMVMCEEKWILYDNWWQPARWLDWEEAPKHFPQPNLHQKEVLVTVWWFAVSRMYYGFLNPCKTITAETFAEQIDEIHWKLQCLQPTLVNRKGPNSSPWQCLLISDCTLHNQCFKSRMNWATSFASSTIFTWPLTNRPPLLQASRQVFAGRTVPQPAGGRRCFPRVRGIPKHGCLCYRNEQTYFSLAKMHWL